MKEAVVAVVRQRAFESRLAELRQEWLAGLICRAADLRAAAQCLRSDERAARRALHSLAHRLKGLAGTHGQQDLSQLAQQLSACVQVADVRVLEQRVIELAGLTEHLSRSAGMPEQLHHRAGESLSNVPLAERPLAAPTPTDPDAEPGTAEPVRARVLALDDEPSAARLLGLTLTRLGGFDTEVLRSAAQAVQRLSEQRFDLIISDAMMPDMDGQEFCQRARTCHRGAAVPIVILSAATPQELGWSQRDAAYDAWLRKPFRPQPLCWTLRRLLLSSLSPT